jgi:hypothetical protein
MRFHEPKVSFVIEPTELLLDYLNTENMLHHGRSYLELVKSQPGPQALYICAVHGTFLRQSVHHAHNVT